MAAALKKTNNEKIRNTGFTIIEVMIVLVVAATIILIVFLAVPALQRNSRNNQRRQDAGRVYTAAQEWRTNHNNQLPDCNDMQNPLRTVDFVPDCLIRAQIEEMAGKLSYYSKIWSIDNAEYPDIVFEPNALTTNTDVLAVVADSVFVRSGTDCGDQNNLKQGSGMVVIYSQETSSGIVLACRG